MKRLLIPAMVALLAFSLLKLNGVAVGQGAEQSADFEVVVLVLDFPPGTWTPPHTHGSPGWVTVIEGEMTLRMAGTEQTFQAGEGWEDVPNVVHEAGNAGTAPARLTATFLIPRGAPLTTSHLGATQQAPPGPTTVINVRFPGTLPVAAAVTAGAAPVQAPARFEASEVTEDLMPTSDEGAE